ncbi:MAG: Stp1/IreP family PP2C-type Ser/Thr phosphatase [Elusimicrobia bacterium]|jgi:serine/threonine protein phosphatase PrpC|nr:Stp1/IreP family PP2C-type Ser/Thr phosphatase [Elusimicrobiota bacterium]
MNFVATVLTDTGKVRHHNEDSCLLDDELGLVVVADGMGGHAAGEVASRLAVDVVRDQVAHGLRTGTIPACGVPPPHWSDRTRLLAAAVFTANEVIYQASQERVERQGMGTTIVAVLRNGSRLSVIHVGDSRFYLFRGGELAVVTRDHSLVAEQVAQGVLSPAEAEASESGNILTRALGVGPTIEMDAAEPTVCPGDLFLLCSDGLTKMADDEILKQSVREINDPQRLCPFLVRLALDRGGRDNVTVAVGRVGRERLLDRARSFFRSKMLTSRKNKEGLP